VLLVLLSVSLTLFRMDVFVNETQTSTMWPIVIVIIVATTGKKAPGTHESWLCQL
jgi:hypothetical protein